MPNDQEHYEFRLRVMTALEVLGIKVEELEKDNHNHYKKGGDHSDRLSRLETLIDKEIMGNINAKISKLSTKVESSNTKYGVYWAIALFFIILGVNIAVSALGSFLRLW